MASAEPTSEETTRLDLEFRQHLHILRPYLINLVDSDVMECCGAWIERLTRCEAHERRARNRAVFALCYQLSRGMLAPPFLTAPPDNQIDLSDFLADGCIDGEMAIEEGSVAVAGVGEGAAPEIGGGCGGSEGTMTARTRSSVQLPPSSAELWVNPEVTLSKTEYDSCSMQQQISADTRRSERERGGGRGGRGADAELHSTASLSAVTAWVSSSLQEIPKDAAYDARAASLRIKLRDIKQQNTFLNEELHALKQESHSRTQHNDAPVDQKVEEGGVLRRRLAQATQSRRLLQDAVSALECRLNEVREMAIMELRDAEVKYKMEVERMRAAMTHQLERAAREYTERLQRAADKHAINIREVEERWAQKGAEARAAHDAALQERDTVIREKEQEIKRLQTVVEDYADKLQTAARSEEERRASSNTREQALEERVARAERARARYARLCKARVARAQRETQLAECRSQLKLAEQRAQLRDAAARDSEAEVTRAVGALETKYKDIVASVQAAAIKRRMQDQLSLQLLLHSCGLRVNVGTPSHPGAPAHHHRAYDAMQYPAATAEKHAEHAERWECAGAERDLTPAPHASAPQAGEQRPSQI